MFSSYCEGLATCAADPGVRKGYLSGSGGAAAGVGGGAASAGVGNGAACAGVGGGAAASTSFPLQGVTHVVADAAPVQPSGISREANPNAAARGSNSFPFCHGRFTWLLSRCRTEG